MLRNRADSEADHQRFIQRVIVSETVWALNGKSGFAWCESNEQEDADVIVFWSDRAYADRARKPHFPECEPVELTLFDFLFRWLIGMSTDGVLAGTNWSGDLTGIESQAEALQNQITDQMPKDMLGDYIDRLKRGIAEQQDQADK